MVALNLSQLRRELDKIEKDIKEKASMPEYMDVNLPCRAAMDLSPIRFDMVKVTVRFGTEILFHFFRDD